MTLRQGYIDAGNSFRDNREEFVLTEHEALNMEPWELKAIQSLLSTPFPPFKIEVHVISSFSSMMRENTRFRITYPVPVITLVEPLPSGVQHSEPPTRRNQA